ncbi:unnamed protein product [Clonostachys byssicola]|uniref:cutinase n=1 Tax=Clonostachys byssicola TaxID=160290 RepID=A0A9N9Y9M2_9HYPO|nr:unnamed protein product [Clonostachys byssicola]
MKFTLAAAIAVAVSAVSAISPRAVTDTEMGWGKALAGDSKACADLAVIFARGTFDPGNIGPWVGAPFRDALAKTGKKISFQGVDPGAYPADLAGYIVEGGSEQGAKSMGVVIDAYVKACPKAKIAVSCWSQGCLVARKSFGIMSAASAKKVIAYVSFGDPYPQWTAKKYPKIPANAKPIPFCTGSPSDALCGKSLFDFPNNAADLIDHFKKIFTMFNDKRLNDAQRKARDAMLVQLPLQASKQLGTLVSDLKNGHRQRWELSPQHFFYGLDGSTTKAAQQLVAAM